MSVRGKQPGAGRWGAGVKVRRCGELAVLGDICGEGAERINVSWGGALMRLALAKFRSPKWRSNPREAHNQKAADAAKTNGAAALVPNVIPFNEEIEPQAKVESIVVQPVDTTHWDPRLESVKEACQDECLAKLVFQHACMDASGRAAPVALKMLNKTLRAFATEDVLPGGLVIPVLCFRDSSIHTPSSIGYHSKDGVFGSVKWKQPVDESSVRDVEINIQCQPEPDANTMFKGRRDATSVCNTFWYIRRSYHVTRSNSAIGSFKTKVITSAPMTELKTDSYHHKPGLLEFEVTIPSIVNNIKITGGTEIVLWLEQKQGRKGMPPNQKRILIPSSARSTKFQKR